MNTFFDLLGMKAFSPDVLDPAYTIKSRLSHIKSALALSVGGLGVIGYRARNRGGAWEISTNEKIEGPNLSPALLDQGRDLAQSNHVLLSFTPANLLCELESGRLPEDGLLQRSMLTNPKSILRNRYEPDRRYHLIPSLDRKKYISYSVPGREASMLEKMIKDQGMELCRMQIGLANMTEFAVRRLENIRKDGIPRILLLGDQSLILSLAVKDGLWEEPFSFISRSTGGGAHTDAASVVEYLESLASEISEVGVEFHILNSTNSWWLEHAEKWFEKHRARFQVKRLDDVPNHVEVQLCFEG